MPRRDFPWMNPYIARGQALPKLLLACAQDEMTEEERSRFEVQKSQYPQLICEPCSGSGEHLIELAQRYPSALCVGFELRFKRACRTAEKAHRLGINNLLVVRHDAKIMAELTPPRSIIRLQVNFPDPWERHRWQSRRIVSPEFLEVAASRLTVDGSFYYKTDHPLRFQEAVGWLEQSTHFRIAALTEDLHNSDPLTSNLLKDNILTEFEKLFISKKLPVFMLQAYLK